VETEKEQREEQLRCMERARLILGGSAFGQDGKMKSEWVSALLRESQTNSGTT